MTDATTPVRLHPLTSRMEECLAELEAIAEQLDPLLERTWDVLGRVSWDDLAEEQPPACAALYGAVVALRDRLRDPRSLDVEKACRAS